MLTIGASKFFIGDFINAVLSFVVIAAVIYFLVIAPVNKLMEQMMSETPPAAAAIRECPECMSNIPAQGQPLRLLNRRGRGRHWRAGECEIALAVP